MPGRTVQKEQAALLRQTVQDMPQKVDRGFRRLLRQGQGDFLAGPQVECAKEMDQVALGGHPYQRRLSHGRPDMGLGSLKVEAHFVHRDDHPVRVVLQKIGHFFSNSASKSLTVWAFGRERYTRSARW